MLGRPAHGTRSPLFERFGEHAGAIGVVQTLGLEQGRAGLRKGVFRRSQVTLVPGLFGFERGEVPLRGRHGVERGAHGLEPLTRCGIARRAQLDVGKARLFPERRSEIRAYIRKAFRRGIEGGDGIRTFALGLLERGSLLLERVIVAERGLERVH